MHLYHCYLNWWRNGSAFSSTLVFACVFLCFVTQVASDIMRVCNAVCSMVENGLLLPPHRVLNRLQSLLLALAEQPVCVPRILHRLFRTPPPPAVIEAVAADPGTTGYLSFGPIEKIFMFSVTLACARRTGARQARPLSACTTH